MRVTLAHCGPQEALYIGGLLQVVNPSPSAALAAVHSLGGAFSFDLLRVPITLLSSLGDEWPGNLAELEDNL